MKKKNLAFTLAEVLIVIGIIGVVAALTLPNLNHAIGDKETVTKVKKIYSTLSEAFDRSQAIYGPATEWWAGEVCHDSNGSDGPAYDEDQCSLNYLNRIKEFMKVSKVDEDAGPWDYKVTLPGGTTFGAWFGGVVGPSIYVPNADYMGDIDVDIDGPNKGKNQRGYDMFTFEITSQGIYPSGIRSLSADEDEAQERLENACFSMHYCTQWILENDNADYLKADDTGKCKDSDIILNWTTNTSCH